MKLKFCVAALGACLMFSAASAAEVAGVPMKDYHVKAFGGAVQCAVCHETNVPKSRPNDKTCRMCHGPMEKSKRLTILSTRSRTSPLTTPIRSSARLATPNTRQAKISAVPVTT